MNQVFSVEESNSSQRRKPKFPLIKADRALLSAEISEAGGVEILSTASLDENGEWTSLRVLARGRIDQAPAILRGLRPGDILLHNHPSGDLTPSQADLGVAYICGQSGLGFAIHDNACRKAFVVVEPFARKKTVLVDPKELCPILRAGGQLSQLINLYEERSDQIRLMESVIAALNTPCHAILEGETGIGKSMAYLIPVADFVLKNRCRGVISTNTINLQNQLCEKDLPLLKRALGRPFNFCLVKGRGNYLCLRKLFEMENSFDGEWLLEPGEVDEFAKIKEWARKSADGSLSDLAWVPSESLWEKVNSEKDTCLGLKCSDYQRCFFYGARRKTAEADILVVNHHLLFTDLALRAETSEYSQTGIIPAYSVVVLDEAHNLEEVATTHFGFKCTSLGSARLFGRMIHRRGRMDNGVLAVLSNRLSADKKVYSEKTRMALLADIQEKAFPLKEETSDLSRRFFDEISEFVTDTGKTREGEHRLRIGSAIRQSGKFSDISATALKLRDAMKNLKRVLSRIHRNFLAPLEDQDEELARPFEMPLAGLVSCTNRISEICTMLELVFDSEESEIKQFVVFFSVRIRGRGRFSALNAAPIDVSGPMKEKCFTKIPSVVLVSGTLSTGNDFSFIKSRIGLDDPEIDPPPIEGRFPSPFDYRRQTCLLVPTDLPEPSQPGFPEATVDPVFEIAKSSMGGTLVLCTSYSHLHALHEKLAARFRDAGLECFRQGEMERHALLGKFKQDGNAVLFATDSFWEGIDVPGNALRNLIIAKLPFAIPDDPVLVSRQELLEKAGKNSFREYQLPMAAIRLKQGFGRLIRNKTDRGTVWILDKRVVTKFYGKFFLDSLPPSPLHKGPFSEIIQRGKAFFSTSKPA